MTSPQLEHVSFHNVYGDNDSSRCDSLFHLDYPSIQVASLKEFVYDWNGLEYVNRLPELIRIFLQRFVSLERLIIRDKAMEARELLELRQEFRYRTVICGL